MCLSYAFVGLGVGGFQILGMTGEVIGLVWLVWLHREVIFWYLAYPRLFPLVEGAILFLPVDWVGLAWVWAWCVAWCRACVKLDAHRPWGPIATCNMSWLCDDYVTLNFAEVKMSIPEYLVAKGLRWFETANVFGLWLLVPWLIYKMPLHTRGWQ